jgi:hypothetical protein
MTAKKLRPAELPAWPRLMGADKAAAYLDVSQGTLFKLQVQSLRVRGRTMWDRTRLDEYVDRLAQHADAAPMDAMTLLEKLAADAPTSTPRRQGRPKRQDRATA